jgi:cyclomaltodextrinase / maltogenic alpha-amylase / neopullulanase
MTTHWINDAIIYHLYPLRCLSAPENNNFLAAPVNRLEELTGWLDHLQYLGVNTLLLGPIFESTSHGYDTADLFHLDRRLGSDDTLRQFSRQLHERGFRLLLDGVFNHVGRDFWAFRDILEKGESSRFTGWFKNLQFGKSSPCGDPFTYESWAGHYSLVKLNLAHPEVRDHLLHAVSTWITEFGIDGIRLDTADVLDFGFMQQLTAYCRSLKPGFWLMGEVVHGDYTHWAKPPSMLDSVTNYECYKGLYSSFNDQNLFEIAYALNRQFGTVGMYKHLQLYNFVDNHDVNRLASQIKNPAHLKLVYSLLFSMPGVPSIYYGSEWGIQGMRSDHSDKDLRPAIPVDRLYQPETDLEAFIRQLIRFRQDNLALRLGDYQQLLVHNTHLAFRRNWEEDSVVVLLNAAENPIRLQIPLVSGSRWQDLLDPSTEYTGSDNPLTIELAANAARILAKKY